MVSRYWRRRIRRVFGPMWNALWERISDRSKRMCFLTTLYAKYSSCSEDDKDALKIINEELGLSRDTAALRFPTLMAPLIWKRYRIRLCVEDVDRDRHITRLIKRTPCWLLYADEDTMRNDLHRLIEFCRKQSLNVQ